MFIGHGVKSQPPSKDYQLLFEDNFTGTKLNESDWNYRLGPRTGVGIDGLNLKENVYLEDGALHIAVKQEMIKGKLENTGGGIISKHQFGYGYYETLSKPFMSGRGIHSAFWQAGGSVSNNRIFEIDSYEIDSKSPMGCNNLYVHNAPLPFKEVPWPCRANVPFSFREDGWFLDAYEYTPEGVIFYDNGKVVAKAEWNELTAAQVVWLTALNGVGKVEADKLPGETVFKYFRYYAKPYPGINLLPNGNFEYNYDNVSANQPVAWQIKQTEPSVLIKNADAKKDKYFLRIANNSKKFETTLYQNLEYILNDTYDLSAWIRCSAGQKMAEIIVSDLGGKDKILSLPISTQWTKISLTGIKVKNHQATISVHLKADEGQWLEVDDLQFYKPTASGKRKPELKPTIFTGDPIWKIAQKEPIEFTGDDKFYFFSRNVGLGDAMTLDLTIKPTIMANMSPIARMPLDGKSGWAIQLLENGDIAFSVGSISDHQNVVASKVYDAGKEVKITCTYIRGEACIYINNKLIIKESGLNHDILDVTAAGKMGTVGAAYQAVGEVTVKTEENKKVDKPVSKKIKNFSGTIRNLRVYNRLLTDNELKKTGNDYELIGSTFTVNNAKVNTAQQLADKLILFEPIRDAVSDFSILPVVDDNYTSTITSTSPSGIINTDGTVISRPTTTTFVDVTVQIHLKTKPTDIGIKKLQVKVTPAYIAPTGDLATAQAAFGRKKVGFFVHFVPFLTSGKNGVINDINVLADNFDAEQFAQDAADFGLEYVVFTAWHARMLPLFPSKVNKKWRDDRRTVPQMQSFSNRDVIGDLIKALKAKNIDLHLYIHPTDGHDFQDRGPTDNILQDRSLTGFDDETNSYAYWNQYINELLNEICERYGKDIKGFWIDGGAPKKVNVSRLKETLRSYNPAAMIVENLGSKRNLSYTTPGITIADYNAWEVSHVNSGALSLLTPNPNLVVADGKTWPAYLPQVALVIGNGWWAKDGTNYSQYTAKDLYLYNILIASISKSGGLLYSTGCSYGKATDYANGNLWDGATGNGNVYATLKDVNNYIKPIAESVKNTNAGKAYVTNTSDYAWLDQYQWGVSTESADGKYVYLHVVKPPLGKTLSIGAPADNSSFSTNAIVLKSKQKVDFVKTATGYDITLPDDETWDAVNTVIRIERSFRPL